MTGRTPLARQLAGETPRPGPLDALRLARRAFLRGERVDMTALAKELGVSRLTLYRWVGTRDQLLCEVAWSNVADTLQRHGGSVPPGSSPTLHVLSGFVRDAIRHPAMEAFLDGPDARAGVRLLTTHAGGVQPRFTAAVLRMVEQEVASGAMNPPKIPLGEFAFAIVQLIESFVYRRAFTGESADSRDAIRLLEMLLTTAR